MINLTKKQIKNIKDINEIEKNTSIITLKDGKKLLVKRYGKCDYKKCNSFCCKFYCTKEPFFANFIKEKKDGLNIVRKTCSKLGKDGKCKIWKSKKFPNACKNFPVLRDKHYLLVMSKCSFKFQILGELK